MSGTIAQLGIAVDSGDAVQAATDLDKLTQAGVKAEAAADGVTAGFSKAEAAAAALAATEAKLAQTTEDAKARLLAMAKASLDTSQYVQKLKENVTSSATAMDVSGASAVSLAALNKRLQAESDALAGTTERSVQATKQAAAATGIQAEGLQALLAKINPAIAAVQKLDDQQQLLNQHFKAGNIKEVDYKAFSADIDAARAKQKGFNDETAVAKTGLSGLALNSKAARENVLQLGNALAEGNIRIAAHNILEIGTNAGSSALALAATVGPALLAAAAIAGMAVAYNQGAAEAKAYNQSLILTGSYAGVSASQLGDMAKQVSATVGTTGAAADALAALAGGGKIASSAFVEITRAAVSMKEATGKAVSETISEFVKLADDPVKASVALNDQYHYLTASVYAQIAALEEQGNHAAAVKLATDQYAKAIAERTPAILENLSLWEKGYNLVAKAADGLKNVGRAPTNTEEIAAAQKSLDLLQKGINSVAFNNKTYSGADGAKELQGLITFMGLQDEDEKTRLKYIGDSGTAQKESITALTSLHTSYLAGLDKEAQKKEAIRKLDQQRVDALKGSNVDTGQINREYDVSRKALDDKFKDAKGPANQVDLTGFNNAQNALKTLQDTYSNTEKQLEASQKAGLISADSYATQRAVLIKAEKEEVTAGYEAEISALETLRDKSSTTAEQRISLDQKIADARTSMVKAQKDADSQLEVIATNETGRLNKQALAVKTYTDALNQQAVTLRQQGARAAAGLGQGDRQRGLTDQQNGIDDKANAQRIDLANQYGDGSRGMSLDEYNAKLKAVAQSQQELHGVVQSNYDDMTKAQESWSAGASSAYDNYLESARDTAGQTKSLFTNAFSSMEDAIVSFALTGKLSFSDFAKSILADMARIATRQASSSALSGLFGLATTAASTYFGGSSSTSLGASQAGYSSTYFPQAKGGAWSDGVQMFADGGAFTNTVVSKPTAFGMANGKTGVMGEAGDEAIVPLARDSQGRLGVRGGGGNSSTVNVSVTVDASDGGGASPDPARLAEAIKVVCRQEIATARRNGGQLA